MTVRQGSIERAAKSARGDIGLYRRAAVTAFARRADGAILVVAPPSARLAVLLSLLVVTLIGAALRVVEVPQRAPAVGVLMPPDGMVTIAAPVDARVTGVETAPGDDVREGDVLVTISAERNDATGTPLARETLASLERELDIATDLYRKRDEQAVARARDLDVRLGAAVRRAAIAAEDLAVAEARIAIREKARERARALHRRDLLARATLEDREEAWLSARALAVAAKRAANDAERLRDELEAAAARLEDERQIVALEYARERERLERHIRDASLLAAQQVVAPRAARIAHVAVNAGSNVRAGQLLMTLYEPGKELEAWLYVTTADAARLRPGLDVRLKLDAWPHQRFGAPSATITSISVGALLPAEVSVPLALDRPVFEVRARLERQTVSGFEREWALKPGTSFRADLVRARYRLYEWLGRNLKHAVDGGPA